MSHKLLLKTMHMNDQKKGMLLAFGGIMFITPDSLLIRLADISSWNLIFYRGFIPVYLKKFWIMVGMVYFLF